MNTLVIYDNTGFIISQMAGDVREPVGIPFQWVEIPEGKRLVSIDTSVNPHTPVFEDLPVSELVQIKDRLEMAEGVINMIIMEGGM